MENKAFISIIIPIFNKEQYIERCFNSVVMQVYKNIECIIVDDCSTDNSFEIIDRLIKNYKGDIKFRLIRCEKNGGPGPSSAKNTAIDIANGEYLFFFDVDDEITENCINALVALVKKYPGVDMVQGGIKHTDYLIFKDKLPEFVNGNQKIKKKYYWYIPVPTWNKLVRKEFIINNNLYFKKGLVHEDEHWKFFLLKNIRSLASTNEDTYIYHTVPNSVMTNQNLFPSISTCLTIAEDMLSNLDVDILEQQLLHTCDLLNVQKKRITSDEKYTSLMPRCEELLAKMPGGTFFLKLTVRETGRAIKAIVRGVFGEKTLLNLKKLLRK